MNIPRVKFIDMPLLLEVDWIHGFLFQNEWGWGEHIIRKHPGMEKVFALKKEEQQIDFIKDYVVEFKRENRGLIEENRGWYQEGWKVVEEDYFIVLAEIMQTDWPKDKEIIQAMISVNPICPRFLHNWSFSIFCNYEKISDAIEVIMHECCHFLYFEKWKKIYPETDEKKFEWPYLEWHLSEIVAPVILNDSRAQSFLKKKAAFYEIYKDKKIGEKSVPEYFTDLYDETVKVDGFEEFVRKSYEVMRDNKELFGVQG